MKKLLLAGLAAGVALSAGAAMRRGSVDRSENKSLASRRFADVNGIRMSWLEEGEGTPVILLHGIPTSPELWRHVIPRLSGVRVLAWEMVGYGESMSEGINRDISVAAQAEYLASWMRELGLEKAIIAGHDLGGGVAQILAVRHPRLCSGLFLTNAIGYDSWPIPSVIAMREAGAVIEKLPDPLFAALLFTLFVRGHDDFRRARDAARIHVRKYLDRDGAAAMVRQVRDLDVQDTLAICDKLASLNVPARLVWGGADRFLKLKYGRRFARDLSAPLRVIPGGKHFTPEDHPEAVAEEIMLLVAEAASAPGSSPAAQP